MDAPCHLSYHLECIYGACRVLDSRFKDFLVASQLDRIFNSDIGLHLTKRMTEFRVVI